MFGGHSFFDAAFGGMGGGPGISPAQVDNTRYYDILGVDKNASDDQIKKAHRKLALRHHPDKGGDGETFKEINQAYDVLKDPEKRRVYDMYGEEAVREGMGEGGQGGMTDLFEGLFGMGAMGGMGMGGMGGRSRGPRKGEDVVQKIRVRLKDLYTGTTRKVPLTRQVCCRDCNGVGTASGRTYQCQDCRGQGMQVRMRQLGPGMFQQIQQPCPTCGATGKSVPPSDTCVKCNGSALVQEEKEFEITIEQGMRNGQRITLRGEAGSTDPNILPGDVLFIIETLPEESIKRVNSDLITEFEITLKEALCGVNKTFTHLDDRVLKIATEPGEVIKPESWMNIEGEGMPLHGSPFVKGNLYLHFKVVFPDSFSLDQVETINALLSGPSSADKSQENNQNEMETDDAEEVVLSKIDNIEDELQRRQEEAKMYRTGQAYESDSDEEFPRGAQRVQCAQQ
eukprot:TRINITY_DN3841_c0_g2_i14.p1 TRINITY_DN3841_c0_g2~~TRINITY_DN3841_c0_g2_i14.p1  ORF type:complete len:453 (+),score=92.84 TRINITY_DN3841_c0_g2_i14:129-1487(+)